MRDRPAITALRLLAVLNVLLKYARIIQQMRRRASRPSPQIRSRIQAVSSVHVLGAPGAPIGLFEVLAGLRLGALRIVAGADS